MTDALFDRAWVWILCGAAAGLTIASLARADIVVDEARQATQPLSPPAADNGAQLPDAPAVPDLTPPSSVPSEPVGSDGSGAPPATSTAAPAGSDGSGTSLPTVAVAPPATAITAPDTAAVATPIVVPPREAPADVPAAATRVGTDDAPCAFALQRSQLTRGIVDQRPAPATSPFEADGRTLYLWVETNNIEGRGQQAVFRWVHETSDFVTGTRLDLAISARWRTWTSVELPPTLFGPWRVEVIDHDGCQVDLLRFEMLPRGW